MRVSDYDPGWCPFAVKGMFPARRHGKCRPTLGNNFICSKSSIMKKSI